MPTPRPEHAPQGDPCEKCGRAAARHRKRMRHACEGDPCRRCGLPAKSHRSKSPKPSSPRKLSLPSIGEVVAIDGEGYTTKDGRHLYTYMSASSSSGLVSEIENPRGLRTQEIFDWLLALPKRPKKVCYSFGYDLTKWCEDLPPAMLYLLWRPDQRAGKHGPRSLRVAIRDELYSTNLVATKFSLAGKQHAITRSFQSRVVVWDVFKFFGRAFVSALEQWDVGTPEERAEIQAMKDKRGDFRGISEEEKAYCRKETLLLARLVEKLLEACEDADLHLKDLYGPGSLAAAMLSKGKAKRQIVDLSKRPQLADAVQRAFFGGRFEINRVGPVRRAHNYDLASAYPCAETQLPCLEHGEWRRVKGATREISRQVRKADAALVRWHLPPCKEIPSRPVRGLWELPDFSKLDLKSLLTLSDLTDPAVADRAWGPFPYRTRSGSILFPVVCPAGGWVYHHEFLAALAAKEIWPNVEASEAWIYETSCDCERPYAREVAEAYVRRLEWGKEGRGLTLKLAVNSRYGKRAQSSGSHPFRCLLAAGLITSHTRGAILRALAAAPDPWDVVSVATDGVISRTLLHLPDPPRTGTERAAVRLKKSRLGEWEHKGPDQIFLIRPGMRFAMDLNDKLSTTAARGLGVRTLHAAREKVLRAWKRKPLAPLTIQQPSQFHGAKLSITVRGLRTESPSYHRTPLYGLWDVPDPYKVSYEPLPKRPCVAPDGRRVLAWALSAEDPPSAPYDRKVSDDLNRDLSEAEDVADAQPDRDPVGPVDDFA